MKSHKYYSCVRLCGPAHRSKIKGLQGGWHGYIQLLVLLLMMALANCGGNNKIGKVLGVASVGMRDGNLTSF